MSGSEKAKKLWGSLKGVVIAFAIVFLIVGGLWAYSGVWPPLVVIESGSMQHSDTRSYIGVIDTGDLVILKQQDATSVRTYLESVDDGYSTYGELGDVVIYRPFGSYDRTPIIHRALCRVVYNASGGGFDVPALASLLPEQQRWEVKGGESAWYDIHGTLVLYDVGYNDAEVRINFTVMLSNFANAHLTPHGGFITLGDNNHGIIDQSSMSSVCWRPVKDEWLNGVARGELPWFGLIKLYVSGQASQVSIPQNSQTNLIISLGLIIGIPIAIDAISIVLESKGISVGAWFRKKLGMPPKQPKKVEEPEPDPPPKKGSAKDEGKGASKGSQPKEGSKKSSSSQKPKGKGGNKGKGSS
ncbi:MAG: S26 family signal peptidase [Methanomassiliicoccales archaeon]|nr:S26 family signal peptidase [Methanomassiliicoccales archaeon]MDD1756246.1 S26 family signal peptidase [Methanomassiliicoccales archaeon]